MTPRRSATACSPTTTTRPWSARFTPVDASRVAEGWICGIAPVHATTTAHANGAQSASGLTATWLLQRQASGEWLIVKQVWNLKPKK